MSDDVIEAVMRAIAIFREYEQMHLAKVKPVLPGQFWVEQGNVDATAKAARNAAYAEEMEAAITAHQASLPSSPVIEEMEGLLEREDNDHMVATGDRFAWLVEQIIRWPTRIDPDKTTNDRFLRMSAVATLLALARSGIGERDKVLEAEQCRRCGGDNPPWSAPSPLWNAVMRGGSIDGAPIFEDMVCATCFMVLAEERGIASRWRVEAELVNVPLETVTPSGRRWDANQRLWIDP